jgi:hypothetical protein
MRKGGIVAQRSIEILIGRLLTDEAFRVAFLDDAYAALAGFAELGHELTSVEIAALTAIHPEHWTRMAGDIDPRLQKASLKSR